MLLTFKYRLKDGSAKKRLTRHAFAVNQVWNYCTAQQRDTESRFRSGAKSRRWASHFDLQGLCKGAGKELGLQQQSVGEVCRVFSLARDRLRHAPRFRSSSGTKRALGWIPFTAQGRQICGNCVTYLGRQYRWFGNKRRPLPDVVKGGAFVEDARGRWYVCFHVDVAADRLTGNAALGIDLGLKALATCSDGVAIKSPRSFHCHERQLAVAQRASNKRRARAVHAKIKNCRKDFLHKMSTKIARENALIAVGNVKSSQLAKTRMAKSVLDASWSMFRNMLRYKASRHGAIYLDVDERFTTRTCSSCGVIPDSSPKGMGALGIRAWDCSECGASHDRDVNAARNILALALSAQRRDDGSREALAVPDKHARHVPAANHFAAESAR